MLHSNSIYPSPSPPTLYTSHNNSNNIPNGSQLSWEFLRKQARQLENEIEQKLTSYSKIATSVGRNSRIVDGGVGSGNAAAGNSNEAMELELDELLKKLSMVVNSMAEVVDRPTTVPTSPSIMHMLQRHRDILYDYTKEFKKTRANIQAARNHADLLSSVREDISSFKSGVSSETDYFLSERGRIENSHRMADMVLEQAFATREEFGRQGATLLNINKRIAGVTSIYQPINFNNLT
ncbi:8421_t:CDS:2 [Ambispora leptoticha]|uniref:Golgi SNAP receptor complex member 1 n=1 Tax=Ambispora leptoticha TaxID=144679 RepID=A0A9N8ZA58_9GLOM|nr:8421_t:CDS:2 [Ambispora leptoticha]